MKTRGTLALWAILSLTAAPLNAAPDPVSMTEPAPQKEEYFVEVMSPWGYVDWYWVSPGRNYLICTTTGNPFDFFY